MATYSSTRTHDAKHEGRVDAPISTSTCHPAQVACEVRDAADEDYRVVVVEDACADADAEVHRVLMEKVFPRQATVARAEAVAAAIAGQV